MNKHIRCNNCYAVFADEGDLNVIVIEGGETIHGCGACKTDAYLMDMEDA